MELSPTVPSYKHWADKAPKRRRSCWDWLYRRRLVVPVENVEAARDLSSAFCEHTWDVHRIVKNFPQSNINPNDPSKSGGLSSRDVVHLLGEHSENALPKTKEISDIALFLKQFLNLLWLLLNGVATLSLLGYLYDTSVLINLYSSLVVYFMIFVLCTISWYQERKALRVIRGFQNLLPEACSAIRDGREERVPATQLVIGDVIHIRSGGRVPADARILLSNDLHLETSSITGEAKAVRYRSDAAAENVTVFQSHNIAFNGSMCVQGSAVALVIRTGANTIIGQIAEMTTNQSPKRSLLEKEILRFIKFLVIMSTSVAGSCFIVAGFLNHWTGLLNLLANGFLVCAIGMVPCGLPATVTSILTIIARKMADRNVYLKRLDIVEALGCTTIIASDKTGTLTKNQMTVTHLWHDDVTTEGYEKLDTNKRVGLEKRFSAAIARMLTVMTVCNVSEYTDEPKEITEIEEKTTKKEKTATKRRPARGTPTEIAMLDYADRVVDVKALRQSYNTVFEIAFNSMLKYHLRIFEFKRFHDGNSEFLMMVKGAPEILLDKCSNIMFKSGLNDFDRGARNRFEAAYHKFAADGKRVIGFVEKRWIAPTTTKFSIEDDSIPSNNMTFIGMCAIMDPPRDETAQAITECKMAGIRVFMVTGDHPDTAAAIARQIGLIGNENDPKKDWTIIHGERITLLSESEWDALLCARNIIFARTTPEQKLLIVSKCQKRGEMIAMTGDGVNDAPALKKADIGIAMGSGSEVAKQSADIILMDDNFASIVKAIEQGRLMFDNIKKLLGYTMPHSFPEVYPVIVNFVFGLNHFLGGAGPPLGVWIVVACVSFFIFGYNELRKYCIRRWPTNRVVHWFKW